MMFLFNKKLLLINGTLHSIALILVLTIKFLSNANLLSCHFTYLLLSNLLVSNQTQSGVLVPLLTLQKQICNWNDVYDRRKVGANIYGARPEEGGSLPWSDNRGLDSSHPGQWGAPASPDGPAGQGGQGIGPWPGTLTFLLNMPLESCSKWTDIYPDSHFFFFIFLWPCQDIFVCASIKFSNLHFQKSSQHACLVQTFIACIWGT